MPQSTPNENSGVKGEKMKKIEKTVRTQVECEERAFRIVNKLIYDYVDGEYLIDCGQFITAEHYRDIAEERAISRICGYPVCPKPLGDTPKKKYHISMRTNKVYDISERKNFCSNPCFTASRHFSAQIPDSPLWMRDKVQAPNITLLQHDQIKGIAGDEVIGADPRQALKEDLEDLEKLDKKTSTSKPLTKSHTCASSERQHTTKLQQKHHHETQTSKKETKGHETQTLKKETKGHRVDGTSPGQENAPKEHKASEEECTEKSLGEREHGIAGDTNGKEKMPDIGTSNRRCGVQAEIENVQSESICGDGFMAEKSLLEKSVDDLDSKSNWGCDENADKALSEQFEKLSTKEPTGESFSCLSSNITSRESGKLKCPLVDNANEAKSQAVSGRNISKMDQLKELMSKRRNVLSKMADIQTVDEKCQRESNTRKDDLSIKTKVGSEKLSSEGSAAKTEHAVATHPASSKVSLCTPATTQLSTPATTQLSTPATTQLSTPATIQLSTPATTQLSTPATTQHSTQQKSIAQNVQACKGNSVKPEEGGGRRKQPLVHVCDILKSWMTKETSFYLLTTGDSQDAVRFSDPRVQQGYGHLCRRLAKQEKEIDEVLDCVEDGDRAQQQPQKSLKPVPDYKALKADTEAFGLTVMEFITGKKQQAPKKEDDPDDANSAFCLPNVDAYNQHEIRVKIVLDRLDKSLPDVLTPLQLSVQDVSSPIRELVHTCRLEKDNIVLKPGEWTLAALLLLTMLSTRYPRINSSFKSEGASRHFSAVLSRLGHSLSDLKTFAQDITDVSLSLR